MIHANFLLTLRLLTPKIQGIPTGETKMNCYHVEWTEPSGEDCEEWINAKDEAEAREIAHEIIGHDRYFIKQTGI